MRRTPAWMAVLCAIAAAVVVLIGGLGAVGQFDLRTVRVDPSATFEVVESGPLWLVAMERRSRIDDKDVVGGDVTTQDVTLVDPAGATVVLDPLEQHITYTQPNRVGEIIGRFKASAAGTWTIKVDQEDAPVLLAIGEDRLEAMAWWTLVSGAVAIALLGVALGCGWVAFRTARLARRLELSS